MSKEIVIKRTQIEKRIPGLLDFIALDDIQVELRRMNKHFEKSEFQGIVDPRTINATDSVGFIDLIEVAPYTPWISASAHNYGLNTVYLSINNQFYWIPLRINEGHNFDFAKSDQRISEIYYKCDSGETATVQINGKY